MASVGPLAAGFKQAGGFFVPLENLTVSGKVLAYTPGSGAGGSYANGAFTVAPWATFSNASASPYTSTISAIAKGGVLRDMGRTVVSAGRAFRKIQLLTAAVSTGGVGGTAPGATANTDYLTGYIEIGGPAGVNTSAAQVAYYPRLM